MPDFIDVQRSGRVAVITLNRPKLNALSRAMQDEIAQAAHGLRDDVEVRAVVIHGGERSFAAGADVKEMVHWDHAAAWEQAPQLQAAFTAVAELPQPTIAALTGYALGGGCELALACDLRIAADDAVLGQPEILLGIIPGAGGTQRLSRLIGAARAKELILTGRQVRADEALAMGLVNEVTTPDQVLPRALALAAQLARGPREAMAAAKRVIDAGADLPIAEALSAEAQAFASLFGTPDQAVGMESFVANGPGKAEFS